MRARLALGTFLCLGSSSVVAIAAMIHGAGKLEWNSFYPWVLAPYFALFAVQVLPRSQSEPRRIANCVTAGLAFLLTCWFYIESFWFSASSTSALIIIFAPIYLLVGGAIVWGVTWFLFHRSLERLRSAPTE